MITPRTWPPLSPDEPSSLDEYPLSPSSALFNLIVLTGGLLAGLVVRVSSTIILGRIAGVFPSASRDFCWGVGLVLAIWTARGSLGGGSPRGQSWQINRTNEAS